jgi:hypothetical protein
MAKTQADAQQAQGSTQKNPTKPQPTLLKGWKDIAQFLGQPVAVAQRWAGEGMPVRREGRYVETTPEELSRWLGRESGTKEPVRIATDDADLSVDLRRGLAELKRHKRQRR